MKLASHWAPPRGRASVLHPGVGGCSREDTARLPSGSPLGAFRALDKKEEFPAGLVGKDRKGSRCALNTDPVHQIQHLPRGSALCQAD